MRETMLSNLEFQLTFLEKDLRCLLSEEPPDKRKIKRKKYQIARHKNFMTILKNEAKKINP
jgi:hypothetical protein